MTVEEYLDRLEKEWIDEQFAQMEHDERYRVLNLQIAREFEASDCEALQMVEGAEAETRGVEVDATTE